MRTYIEEQACAFRFTKAPWGAFSNFQPLAVPILAGPVNFGTSEAAYQACKFPAHPDVQQRIAEAPTAREAAAIGRTPGLGIDPGWNEQRVDVMRWVLRMKREANAAEIDAVLAETGERPIVEVSTRDPLVGRAARRRSLRGPQRPRPVVDGIAATASRGRPGCTLRRLDRTHPHRLPRRRHPSRASRAAGRLIACPPTTADRPRSLPRAGERGGRSDSGEVGRPEVSAPSPRIQEPPMPDPDTISADYTLRPSELAATLKILVEARQPVMVWGGPGCGKSEVAQQVAAEGGRAYCDVRALLLDPVDLRGIPWRDNDNRTRWAPPDFLPPTNSTDLWLVNLEELPSGVPMVQAALFQLVRDRKCGEYELPEGASLMACGNRESDRGVTHRMPTPLASRFFHLEIKVDPSDWCEWGAANGIAPETLFFIQLRPELLHVFDPQSREAAFACPRTWEFVSNVVKQRGSLDPAAERALFRGAVGEAAAVEFSAFLKVWRELPHPRAVIDDPENADVPENASALIALCGSLYRMADDVNLGSIVSYAMRLRREVGEFLVGSCVRREPALQHTDAFIRWAAARTQ